MIKISVIQHNKEVPAIPVSAVFGPDRKTIGRSEDSDLVLGDPDHVISRRQASVWSEGTKHFIANVSQSNPFTVNDRQVPAGSELAIKVGDEIQIGPYLLQVQAHGASSEPAPARPRAEAPEPQAAAAAPSADNQALMQAFMAGAGVPAGTPAPELTPKLMEMFGKLLACSLQGAIDLNGLRALVKREVQVEKTMVMVRSNNPLKHLPDSHTVLGQMLREKIPGFMPPVEAAEDAFDELRAHQHGTVAGVRASMEGLLNRLAPDNFAAGLPSPSFLDSLVPSRRKEMMWENYARQHQQVRAEAKDEFNALFGKVFQDAYEVAVTRFRSAAKRG